MTRASAVVPLEDALGRRGRRVGPDRVAPARDRVSRIGVAVTCHSPGAMSATRAVIARRPLPGTTRSTDSVALNVSCARGLPLTPMRRPVNRIVTGYGSPSAAASNQ